MEISIQNTDFSNPLRNIGIDSTAVFDKSDSSPTEHASSENVGAASKLDDEEEEDEEEGEDEDLEEDFDDEEDEEDEDEDDDDDEDEDEDEDDEDEDKLQVSERR
jgi:segregation and condensation protein B